MPVPNSKPARLLIRGTIEMYQWKCPRVLFLGPEGANDQIKGGIAEHAVNLSQNCPQCCGKFGQSFDGLLREASRVRLGKYPQVVRGEGGIGDKRHEIVALGDNSATMCSLLEISMQARQQPVASKNRRARSVRSTICPGTIGKPTICACGCC